MPGNGPDKSAMRTPAFYNSAMSSFQTNAVEQLVDRLGRLPGIGKRSAERIVFHLLRSSVGEATELAHAITALKNAVRHCDVCFALTESDRCSICNNPERDQGQILVVEQPSDVVAIETTGLYQGVYHVLMGRLSPLDGVGPNELNIPPLLERAKGTGVHEVILGTNPTLEGDGTALYLSEHLAALGVRVTRLARGLPTGSSLRVVSKAVLSDAIHGRKTVAMG